MYLLYFISEVMEKNFGHSVIILTSNYLSLQIRSDSYQETGTGRWSFITLNSAINSMLHCIYCFQWENYCRWIILLTGCMPRIYVSTEYSFGWWTRLFILIWLMPQNNYTIKPTINWKLQTNVSQRPYMDVNSLVVNYDLGQAITITAKTN